MLLFVFDSLVLYNNIIIYLIKFDLLQCAKNLITIPSLRNVCEVCAKNEFLLCVAQSKDCAKCCAMMGFWCVSYTPDHCDDWFCKIVSELMLLFSCIRFTCSIIITSKLIVHYTHFRNKPNKLDIPEYTNRKDTNSTKCISKFILFRHKLGINTNIKMRDILI